MKYAIFDNSQDLGNKNAKIKERIIDKNFV
jgi:hypothetical protein